MANNKIPTGYNGTYAKAADGSPVLVMVSKSESIADSKEKKTMSEENKPYVPYTTEQKKEYAKQFTRSAYAHMGNIGKRNSFFIYGNLKKDDTATPAAPPKKTAKKTPKDK